MAEENNSEDLSMEDILSSIKNILTEDGAVAPEKEATPKEEVKEPETAPALPVAQKEEEKDETVIEPQEDEEPEEDILDLSPEMRVEDEDIGLDDIKLEDVSANIDNLIAEDTNKEEPHLDISIPTVEEIVSEKEPYLESPISENISESFDDKSDPFFEDNFSDTPLNLDDVNLNALDEIKAAESSEEVDSKVSKEEVSLPSADDFNIEDINSEIASVLEEAKDPLEDIKLPEIEETASVDVPLEVTKETNTEIIEPKIKDVEEVAVSEENKDDVVISEDSQAELSEEPSVIENIEPSAEEIQVSEEPNEAESIEPLAIEPLAEETQVLEDSSLPVVEGFEETPNIFNQDFVEPEVKEDENTLEPLKEETDSTIDSLLENEILPPVEDIESLIPASENIQSPLSEMPSSTLTEKEEKEDKVEEDKVDVSASIINNFAKLLSKDEDKKDESKEDTSYDMSSYTETNEEDGYDFSAIEKTSEEKNIVVNLGDGDKTLSDIIQDVVRQIIGKEVARRWNLSLDYDEIVRQELKKWMDDNLPAMVEDLVKKEIRRVMVKVGDN